MDWKYILSLSPEELTEEEKDELYNSIIWYDSDSEEVSGKKLKILFRVCQEVMKFKGEQVETLLHELDELATKQGEEEAARRMDSDEDTVGKKSRKSSSIEMENLEQKYLEMKNKYKKQVKQNEKMTNDIQKLNKKMQSLEKENKQLQYEVQAKMHEGSESDISETVRDQHRELVEVVQNKNKQISDLLHDIEDVEKENALLREKLTNVRDELDSATKELTYMTERLAAEDVKLQEKDELVKKLTAENDDLRDELYENQEKSKNLEQQMNEFTQEINKRIDDWKHVLEAKDAEIADLKTKATVQLSDHAASISSHISSLPDDEHERVHINALTKTLNEREKQLLELQTQLQVATKEMETSTELINKLKTERSEDNKRMQELEINLKDAQKQLNIAHERCQSLQEEVGHLQKLSASKDGDIKEILDKVKGDGKEELSKCLKQINDLKAQRRLQEKQIISLVKASNKLQDISDSLEEENNFLREQLGISEDEVLNTSSYTTKQRKQKKELDNLKREIELLEEKLISHKSENHKLNKSLASLSNQIIDLGHKPRVDGYFSQTLPKAETVKVVDDRTFKDQLKWLSEENEALRKGMHEVLKSLNNRKEKSLTEIKSETFEKLLRALDVKHISGWYHPAMRLQAELHNLEGINAQLREQLRHSRGDFGLQIKTNILSELPQKDHDVTLVDEPDRNIQQNVEYALLEDVLSSPNNIHKNIEIIIQNLSLDNLEITKKHLCTIDSQVHKLLNDYFNEKQTWQENLQRQSSELEELQEKFNLSEEKLKVFLESQDEESLIRKLDSAMSESVVKDRKLNFLNNQVNKLNLLNEELKIDFKDKENSYANEKSNLVKEIENLETQLKINDNLKLTSVDMDIFEENRKKLDEITIKNRQLINDIKKIHNENHLEVTLLQETVKLLEEEKKDLKNKLSETLKQLHCSDKGQEPDEHLAKLSKKLAETEVNEISERQRANHTNNLYELVKEQLQKSEERSKEFTKYNDEILHKNLILQEQLKEVEVKLSESIGKDLYKELQNLNNNLLEEINGLRQEMQKRNEVEVVVKEADKNWSSIKEQELLNLKHQVVDLIADSDDKMQIGLLHSDLSYYKKLENEQRAKVEMLTKEMQQIKWEHENVLYKCNQEKSFHRQQVEDLRKKVEIMQDLFSKQKLQFLGCIPICSEEKFIASLMELNAEKHETFMHLHRAKVLETESQILKDQYEVELQTVNKQKQILAGDKDEFKNVLNWVNEKKLLQINELRYRRQSEYKEAQINHLLERIKSQDQQIAQLEEDLLKSQKNFDFPSDSPSLINVQEQDTVLLKYCKNEETQTEEISISDTDIDSNNSSLKNELIAAKEQLKEKEEKIEELNNKIANLEMDVSMFKNQIGDKQSLITFFEKHILELQTKRNDEMFTGSSNGGPDGDNVNVGFKKDVNEEVSSLQQSLKSLQESMKEKDEKILEYQSLLKEDRDKHSLAAERMQDELKNLQTSLTEEKQKYAELESYYTNSQPNMATIDSYMNQVHTLEKHIAELHTQATSLDAQLQSSRQEAGRWRILANERLEAMEELRESIEEQHKKELAFYKNDSDKWRQEVNNLKELVSNYRSQTGNFGEDIQNLLKEKDEKVHELTQMLRQAKYEKKKYQSDKSDSPDFSPKLGELESMRENLQKENETIKKRYEHLLNKERMARDEIRELKSQLLKRSATVASSRSEKTEKSIKEQLQKKIVALENEISEVREKLAEQIAINDTHKIKIADDFERWKKLKNWQQNVEKLKNKLKERDNELERVQQTCHGYRLLIERLEREKHNLENRIKMLKKTNANPYQFGDETLDGLRLENMKLKAEIDTLNAKLEMQQHHSGGLGAAMLQEKLEAQERKIAILELTSKGTLEVRTELERLQTAISTVQKKNLCLEAENLDLKLDLEKSNKELPHLREQIQHLQSYVDVLKNEKENNAFVDSASSAAGAIGITTDNAQTKKVAELERTVFILKRVVEKLQTENKRLLNGKQRPCVERTTTTDKLKRENQRLKDQYTECLKKITHLEKELSRHKSRVKFRDDSNDPIEENMKLKEQLDHKSQLLDKVKVLLQRAATREKSLMQEIANLKKDQCIDEVPGTSRSQQESIGNLDSK